MLERLSVRSYVLIDRLDIEFGEGFSVITGETGAGKSILLGALSLILGAKADKDAIRKGEKSAEAAAVFSYHSPAVRKWLEDHDALGDDGEIIIRRSVRETGRSVYTVNGIPVSRKEGEELGSLLVDISSQHAYQALLKPGVYRSMLDDSIADPSILESYRQVYSEYRKTEAELERVSEEIEKSAEERDYIAYCLSELDGAALRVGEDEEIKARLGVINSAEFIRESIASASSELKAGVSSLSEALSVLEKAAAKDKELEALRDRLEPVSIDCEDILLTLRSHMSSVEYSEEELEELNSRLSSIQKMKRRFGGSIESAIRKQEEYRERLRVMDDGEEILSELEKRMEKHRAELEKRGEALTALRKKAALSFSSSIEKTLHGLGMPNAIFRISVDPVPAGPDGCDSVSFMIAPNKGEKLSPVHESASGGELSRILLAIKASSYGKGGAETMLFDEIDSGIGGKSANAVGDELRKLSSGRQVIAITHLPQIAVRADSHYLVQKSEIDGRTVSDAFLIEGEEREKETARLLSGSTSGISLEHARSLLEVDE